MNQVNQVESSGSLSVYPAKRKHGRPRKFCGAKCVPPGFQHETHHMPQRADGTGEVDPMLGQAVSGVIEATFGDGYMITVRVANSPTYYRGVVFKPRHFVPVTPENDIAPHIPMIRRSNVRLPNRNQGFLPSQAISVRTKAMVPPKRKCEPPQTPKTALSVPPMGVRGTVVPVVLQPVNFLNGLNPKSADSARSGMLAFGDKDLHSAEPFTTLPPDQSISAFLSSQSHTGSHQISPRSEPAEKKQYKEDASEIGNIKPVESTDADNSSGASDTQTDSSKEALKPPVLKQESGDVNKPDPTEFFANNSVSKALFNFGTGRMTQLLQAVQENLKDKRVQSGECPQVEFRAE